MPRITWLKPAVRADYLGELMNRYKKANKITSQGIADAMGMNPVSVRNKCSRGYEEFRLSEFKSWCKILGIPAEDAAKAIVLYLEQ